MLSEIISAKDMDNLIEKYPVLVIAFTENGCPACDNIKDDIVEFAKRQDVMVGFVEISLIDLEIDNLTKVPTFSFYKDGSYVGKVSTSKIEIFKRAFEQAFK